MADITAPITPVLPSESSYRSVSIHDRQELRAAVAEMMLRWQLNEDSKAVFINFTCSQSFAHAKFLDSTSQHVVFIDDLRLGYQGTSPGLARQILILLGVPQRVIEKANRAARKGPGEAIEYDIVLEYTQRKGVSAIISTEKTHWSLRVEG